MKSIDKGREKNQEKGAKVTKSTYCLSKRNIMTKNNMVT